MRSAAELFFKKTVPLISGCLNWTGAVHPRTGHGYFRFEGRTHHAHRVVIMLAGREIPAGKHVLHICHNPKCVNVDHLYFGTQQDNMRDKVAAGRQSRGEDHHTSKLTEADVRKIRADKRPERTICKEYGITRTVIGRIRRRETWVHIGG